MKSTTAKPKRDGRRNNGGKRANTGGARPGAGRKPKALILKGSIERLNAAYEAAAPYVQDAMIDLVCGVRVAELSKDGYRVYQQPPDRGMIIDVATRLLGKVTEKVEHSGTLSLEIVDGIRRNARGEPR